RSPGVRRPQDRAGLVQSCLPWKHFTGCRAVANTIEEARYQARRHHRSQDLATDIRTASLDYQIPSDEALQRAFEKLPTQRRHATQIVPGPNFPTALQRQRVRVA